MSDALYEKLIFENEDKGFQYRLVVSEFKEVQYLHLRKYFLSYEGEWIPSSEGAAFPASIQNIFALVEGLLEICSYEEGVYAIKEFLHDKLLSNEQNRNLSK
jgi:Transcriptional Coactivator p15 (PC4)